MSEPEEEEEKDSEAHSAAHDAIHDELIKLLEAALHAGELEPPCLFSELLSLASDLHIDGGVSREEFLETCGQIFDRRLEADSEPSSIN
jgi:hypothetical protein